ncbi:MAG TPA: N(G),N(G)-dimethylarginine dimethylaminohydrolase, partial [Gemmatimonadaceae bacterium]|nr:N(G),N(G)-dimethylarginine dimethylaminohydrolase [Gemmatimonadaceae bacterium]
IALTRPVSASLAECVLTHLDRVPIDVARACEEHAAYERALEEAGCVVRRLAGADELPDAVFIEDTAVVLDELAVLTLPGAASRRPEVDDVAAALRDLRPVARIHPPGTLDGGDVLRVGRTLYVGLGARSTVEGIAQLRDLCAPYGYQVRAVPFRGCLHLKSAVTAIADDLLLVNPAWADPRELDGCATLAVDPAEPFAGNALLVNGRVLHGAHFPRTQAWMRAAGLDVLPVPAGELAKAEGGVTCCSLLVGVPPA